MKVAAIAAASAMAGGLAATWLYRNSVRRLQEASADVENTDFGISSSTDEPEEWD